MLLRGKDATDSHKSVSKRSERGQLSALSEGLKSEEKGEGCAKQRQRGELKTNAKTDYVGQAIRKGIAHPKRGNNFEEGPKKREEEELGENGSPKVDNKGG